MDRLQHNIIITSLSGSKRLVIFENTIINIPTKSRILEFDGK